MDDNALSDFERWKLKKKEQSQFLKEVGFDFSHGRLERDVKRMATQHREIAARYKNLLISC